MTHIVIPVKPLAIAKQRLASVLSPGQRAGLVLAMLRDVLQVSCALRDHNVWLVTRESAAAQLAQHYGAGVIHESEVAGYNAAVSTGLSFLCHQYPLEQNVAVVPADVPQMTADDLRWLVATWDPVACNSEPCNSELCNSVASNTELCNSELCNSEPGKPKPYNPAGSKVRLAPAHDGEGTNGVFLSRPDLLQPVFGKNSFNRFQQDCRTIGIVPDILSDTSLGFDIDTACDLQRLQTQCTDSATNTYVRSLPVIDDQLSGLS